MVRPCVILVPVLARPANVQPLLDSIHAATPHPHRVLFIADAKDRLELGALQGAGADFITTTGRGTYACKINLGAQSSSEPLLFSAADDLRFHPGWLAAAEALLSDTIQVVGTNDMGNPRTMSGEHSTHTLFTRAYIDDPGGVIDGPAGQVLCPQYPHDFCDDEFIQTAKARGVYAHAFDSHVEHLHYLWGKGKMDSTYRKGRVGSIKGRRTFSSRRHLWASL